MNKFLSKMFTSKNKVEKEKSEFCCHRFQAYYSVEKTLGLNIRVLKCSDIFKKLQNIKDEDDKVFFITKGYSGKINDSEGTYVIHYCPFCGVNLKEYYGQNDEYVQEIWEL